MAYFITESGNFKREHVSSRSCLVEKIGKSSVLDGKTTTEGA